MILLYVMKDAVVGYCSVAKSCPTLCDPMERWSSPKGRGHSGIGKKNLEGRKKKKKKSHLTLCNPMDCSPPGSSVFSISPHKNNGVSIPFFRGSSQPRDWTWVCCIADRSFTIWAKWLLSPGHDQEKVRGVTTDSSWQLGGRGHFAVGRGFLNMSRCLASFSQIHFSPNSP